MKYYPIALFCGVTLIGAASVSAASLSDAGSPETCRDHTAIPASTVDTLKRQAHCGHADAQYALGERYEYGDEVSEDSQLARRWYQRAAEQGHIEAQMSLAWLLDDKTEAAHWLNRAADQGDQTAQYNLAWAYIRGVGVAVDYQLARKWFTLAARQGSANAQNALGYILHHGGPGLQPDPVEASHWYRQALRQKHPLTPGNLADLANENPEIILDRARTLFAAPGSNTPHIARLKPGETVHALKQQDGWTAVILDDRRTMGWIKDAVTN